MRRISELNIRKLKSSAVIATDAEPPELIKATVAVSLTTAHLSPRRASLYFLGLHNTLVRLGYGRQIRNGFAQLPN